MRLKLIRKAENDKELAAYEKDGAMVCGETC